MADLKFEDIQKEAKGIFSRIDLNSIFPTDNVLYEDVNEWRAGKEQNECLSEVNEYLHHLDGSQNKDMTGEDESLYELYGSALRYADTLKKDAGKLAVYYEKYVKIDADAEIDQEEKQRADEQAEWLNTDWNTTYQLFKGKVKKLQRALNKFNENTGYDHVKDVEMQVITGVVHELSAVEDVLDIRLQNKELGEARDPEKEKRIREMSDGYKKIQAEADNKKINLETFDADSISIDSEIDAVKKDIEQHEKAIQEVSAKAALAKEKFIQEKTDEYYKSAYGAAYLKKAELMAKARADDLPAISSEILKLEKNMPLEWCDQNKKADIIKTAANLNKWEHIYSVILQQEKDHKEVLEYDGLDQMLAGKKNFNKGLEYSEKAEKDHAGYIAAVKTNLDTALKSFKKAASIEGDEDKIKEELKEKRGAAEKLVKADELRKKLKDYKKLLQEIGDSDENLKAAESELKKYLGKDEKGIFDSFQKELKEGKHTYKELDILRANAEGELSQLKFGGIRGAEYSLLEEEAECIKAEKEALTNEKGSLEQEKKHREKLSGYIAGYRENYKNIGELKQEYADNRAADETRLGEYMTSFKEMYRRINNCRKWRHDDSPEFTAMSDALKDLQSKDRLTANDLTKAVTKASAYLQKKKEGTHVKMFSHKMRYYRIAFAQELNQMAATAFGALTNIEKAKKSDEQVRNLLEELPGDMTFKNKTDAYKTRASVGENIQANRNSVNEVKKKTAACMKNHAELKKPAEQKKPAEEKIEQNVPVLH